MQRHLFSIRDLKKTFKSGFVFEERINEGVLILPAQIEIRIGITYLLKEVFTIF